jgi:hypothetical protein
MPVGGRREGAGRPKGSLNKATADIKAAAAVYSEGALETLAKIMKNEEAPAPARVAAANAILDRAHGKPRQQVDVDAEVSATVNEIVRRVVDPAN